jgi:hypothetical protein
LQLDCRIRAYKHDQVILPAPFFVLLLCPVPVAWRSGTEYT